nr:uncharacterized protein LOC108944065 [Nicotiana tomentosiformis]XP_033510419.1 uncharacterized protein LOC108944065 [Nicotiana tomentosiformis]XP_033510420.1 uncharacterized protein LOC108944065 [Nicotiana tomentosiformis]
MRSTILFRDGKWQKIVSKYGKAMWLKVKVVSKRNRKNREKQITKHACGTRSFVEVEESTRTGYVRGKGYGKKPPKKSHIQAANSEASVSSAMATVRQEMQAEMQVEISRKLQEECEQMAVQLKSNIEQELQKNLEEKLEHVNVEVDNRISVEVDNRISVEVAKRIQKQLAAIMTGMQFFSLNLL